MRRHRDAAQKSTFTPQTWLFALAAFQPSSTAFLRVFTHDFSDESCSDACI